MSKDLSRRSRCLRDAELRKPVRRITQGLAPTVGQRGHGMTKQLTTRVQDRLSPKRPGTRPVLRAMFDTSVAFPGAREPTQKTYCVQYPAAVFCRGIACWASE